MSSICIRRKSKHFLFYADPMIGLDRPTPFPIVFASNTIDPITPLISYVSPMISRHLLYC